VQNHSRRVERTPAGYGGFETEKAFSELAKKGYKIARNFFRQ